MASCQASGYFTFAGSVAPSPRKVCSVRKSQQITMIPFQQCISRFDNYAHRGSVSALGMSLSSGSRIRGHFLSSRRCMAGSPALWQPNCLQRKCIEATHGNSIKWRQMQRRGQRRVWKIEAGLKETELTEQQWGPPIRLGTAQLPDDVDLPKLQSLLYQWGNSLTQNANLPLPVPLKVDRVDGGVRLGYIQVSNGKVEEVVHIDVLVLPATGGSKAMFQAIRNGKMKNAVPPGEPMIMQSLLAALKKAVSMARP